MKTCGKCGIAKSNDAFHKRTSSADGLHGQCKECILSKSKERYASNKSAVLQRNKEYREANRDIRLEAKKDYYLKNKEAQSLYYKEYRSKMGETIREKRAEWRNREREHVNIYSRAFRRKMKMATPLWLGKSDRELISAIYRHARDCEIVTGTAYHVDHIVPLQGKEVCGLHVPWNLQVLPQDVNDAKGNRFDGGW